MNKFIAHRRKDGEEQSLESHLSEVGDMAAELAFKLGVPEAGTVIGLLHDFGKFSASFQSYIGSATGKIDPDEDDYVNFRGLKGKIDHSITQVPGLNGYGKPVGSGDDKENWLAKY